MTPNTDRQMAERPMQSFTTAHILRVLRVGREDLQKYRRALTMSKAGRTAPSTYTFHDLLLLRTIKSLCDAGISVGRIRKALGLIERRLGTARGLQSVRISAVGHHIVVTDATGQWQPDSGQLLLDYDARRAFRIVDIGFGGAAARPAHLREARDWFERGVELEHDAPDEARRAYEMALRLDPSMAEAHINLGVWFHQMEDLEQAERCYRAAIQSHADSVVAYFNLGLVLEARGNRLGAISAHQRVIELEKNHREAHRSLGGLYEAEGRMTEALRHYAAARRLSKPR